MEKASSSIASPCIRNCCLNDEAVCLGCFRSLVEITQWLAADDLLRLYFLDNAAQRRAAYQLKWSSPDTELPDY